MMKPTPITFYVYADDEQQADKLRMALYHLVKDKADKGIAITADKITAALAKFVNNPLFDTFLK